jgi:ribosome-binding ATPase YchF (GTP1/OBG family)
VKIAVVGLEDFPLGKISFLDERLDKLKDILHSPKVTAIQMEFLDSTHAKGADGILCEKNSKLDLVISDLEIIESNLNNQQNKDLFLRCKESLEKDIILNEIPFTNEERSLLLNFNLTTIKPITFVDKKNLAPYQEIARNVFINLGMISFFTANERELRAWEILKGTTVYEASGLIHSDIQRGFIKAEVINYAELIKAGGLNVARTKGLMRLEDKTYVVKDADLIQIRFSR